MGTVTQLRSRNTAAGDSQSFFDAATSETISRFAAVTLDEDFDGPGHTTIPTQGSPAAGYAWVQRLVKTSGSPTVGPVANSAAGIIRLALDSTSEKQEATLYANDALNWDMTKSAIWEARISNHVLPTGVVEMVFGLQSAWIDGPDNASFYAQFEQLSSGAVNMRTKDGVNTLSFATGVTMVADAFHNFRIDATDPTNVRFFIDGAEVSTSKQLSFAATGASAILQPYASVYKASGVGVGSVDVDMIQIGMNRS
ncbi:MAG: hypothetical protein ACRD3Q_02980 [Terriglobales bacterium]